MEKNYILVIDEGTTGVRSMIFDRNMQIIGNSYEKLSLFYPETDYVEQSGMEIYEKTVLTLQNVVRDTGINANEIECIGISTQRAAWMTWRRSDGMPITNVASWMDRRGKKEFDELKADKIFQEKFPQIYNALQPQQSACGLTHAMRNHQGLKESLKNQDVLWGTIDTWITYKLTCHKVFASNASNASTCRLLDNKTFEWDKELLDYLDFPYEIFPEVKNESDDYGVLDKNILGVEIPITGLVADQQGALFSQGCMDPLTAKSTNGTGSFVSFNLGEQYLGGKGPYTSLVAWKLPGNIRYMVEGFLPTAGAALEWLKNDMHMAESFEEINQICKEYEDAGGVCFSPSLNGFRAPINDPTARAAFLGISGGTRREHCIRAVVEAIAYANAHIIEDVCEKFGIGKFKNLRISGGVVRNPLVGQMIANITGTTVEEPVVLEASAMGAAEFAGIYTGRYTVADVQELIEVKKYYRPDGLQNKQKQTYESWKQAIYRTTNWNF